MTDFCPHCMGLLEKPENQCPHCGGSLPYTAQGHHLPAGTVLQSANGHIFRFGAVKGEGGFGITYIAQELRSGRVVAIKEYYPTRCSLHRKADNAVYPRTDLQSVYMGGMQSFLSEASMLQAVRDIPSIVQVLDYFEANHTAYLVMEYLSGHTLQKMMEQAGFAIPPDVLLPKIHPLMRDLYTLHGAGVIHRDIAPDNIMWMPDGTLKLLDFGCARSTEDGKSMTVLLKHGFAPVEQYQTRGQGPYTDVYALCATIYYCLTGKVPPAAVDRLFEDDPLLPPSAFGVQLSREQEQALLWGLTVQPSTRPQNMKILADRLFRAPFPPVSTSHGPDPIPEREQIDPSQYSETVQKALGKTAAEEDTVTASPLEDALKTAASAEHTQQSASGHTVNPLVNSWKTSPKPDRPDKSASRDTSVHKAVKLGIDNRNLLVGVIAAAAVVIVVLVAVLIGMGISGKKANMISLPAEESKSASSAVSVPVSSEPEKPSAPAAASETSVPAEPEQREGETEDGFTYRLTEYEDGKTDVTLTGYTGRNRIVLLPDEIEDCAVTGIAEKAFAGEDFVFVALPNEIETIGNGAFWNCRKLRVLAYYGDKEEILLPGGLTGCDQLCMVYSNVDVVWEVGEKTGSSTLTGQSEIDGFAVLTPIALEDGMVYVLTQDETALLYSIPADAVEVEIPEEILDYPVTYIAEKALKDCMSLSKISVLGDHVMYHPELLDAFLELSDGYFTYASTFSSNWDDTCLLASLINESRPDDAPEIVPNEGLVEAATVRAKELSESYSSERPDGSDFVDFVNSYYDDWSYVNRIIDHVDNYDEEIADCVLEIADDYTEPTDHGYHTELGLAIYKTDGEGYVATLATIP